MLRELGLVQIDKMGPINIDRKEAHTHFIDEEMKSQISSCFAREAPWMANNGAGTSSSDFLAPELRCFLPHLARAQKNRSWNKAIT